MKKLRIGLIGLGNVSAAHLHAYKEVDQIEVVAGADLLSDRLQKTMESWNIKGYSDYEEMLKKEDLDIACVLTPPLTHRTITEKVAEYGVSVLCEKPIALTIDDANAMIQKCRKEGVKLCYGSTYRFLPACRKAKEIIDEGKLGNLFIMIELLLVGAGVQNWKPLISYPIGGPGGGGWSLIDHGIHLVDLFRWFTRSEVESVFGRVHCSGEAPGSEYLTIRFENEAIGQLISNESTFSSDMPNDGIFSWGMSWGLNGDFIPYTGWEPHPGNIRIHGERGALRVFHYANKLFFFGEARQEQVRVLDRPFPANFALQMESFANRLLQDEDPEVTGIDGLKALQVILAACESYKTEKAVRIERA